MRAIFIWLLLACCIHIIYIPSNVSCWSDLSACMPVVCLLFSPAVSLSEKSKMLPMGIASLLLPLDSVMMADDWRIAFILDLKRSRDAGLPLSTNQIRRDTYHTRGRGHEGGGRSHKGKKAYGPHICMVRNQGQERGWEENCDRSTGPQAVVSWMICVERDYFDLMILLRVIIWSHKHLILRKNRMLSWERGGEMRRRLRILKSTSFFA